MAALLALSHAKRGPRKKHFAGRTRPGPLSQKSGTATFLTHSYNMSGGAPPGRKGGPLDEALFVPVSGMPAAVRRGPRIGGIRGLRHRGQHRRGCDAGLLSQRAHRQQFQRLRQSAGGHLLLAERALPLRGRRPDGGQPGERPDGPGAGGAGEGPRPRLLVQRTLVQRGDPHLLRRGGRVPGQQPHRGLWTRGRQGYRQGGGEGRAPVRQQRQDLLF